MNYEPLPCVDCAEDTKLRVKTRMNDESWLRYRLFKRHQPMCQGCVERLIRRSWP